MVRKIIAVAMILAGAGWLALVMYANHTQQQRASQRLPIVMLEETTSLKESIHAFFLASDGLNSPLPESLVDPSIRYVSQSAQAGDGSRASPWNDLQFALCQLQPGQTLMVLEGDFGPLLVDQDCSAGTEVATIDVYFSRASRLIGAEGPDAAMLDLRQPHWSIYGLEAILSHQQTGVSIAPGNSNIYLEALKIRGGSGQGVRIGFGARDVKVHRSHIHHIGINAQGTAADASSQAVSAAVVMEPGVRNISITESKFHHIGHAPIRAITADEMAGMIGLPAPEFFVDEATQSPGEEDAWWSPSNQIQ